MGEQKSLYLENCEIREDLGEDVKFFELKENDLWEEANEVFCHEEKSIHINRMSMDFENEEFNLKYEILDYINWICVVNGGTERQQPLVNIEVIKFLRKKDEKIFYLINCHRLYQIKIYDNVYENNYFGAYYTSYFANENCSEVEDITDIYAYHDEWIIGEYFELLDSSNCCHIYNTSSWNSAIIKMARFYKKSNDLLYICERSSNSNIDISILELVKKLKAEYANITVYREFEHTIYCEESLSSEVIYKQHFKLKINTNEDKFDVGILSKIFDMDEDKKDWIFHESYLDLDITMIAKRAVLEFNMLPLTPKINTILYVPDYIMVGINKSDDKKMTISRKFSLANEKKFKLLNSMLDTFLTDEKIIED